MALNLQDKKEIVAEVNAAASSAMSVVIAQPRGVEAPAMTSLRKQALEEGVCLRVVRNTLARLALEGTSYKCLTDALVGPTLLAFSNEHPGAAARMLVDFARENPSFEVKSAAFEGEVTDIEVLAKIPTYDEGILRLIMCMKEASIGRLVLTMAAICDQRREAF
jgi:large subunit ribosomal protein L10